VQVTIPQQKLQPESAGNVGVGQVGQLLRPHDHHHRAFGVRICSQQIHHPIELATTVWRGRAEQPGTVGGTSQMLPFDGQLP